MSEHYTEGNQGAVLRRRGPLGGSFREANADRVTFTPISPRHPAVGGLGEDDLIHRAAQVKGPPGAVPPSKLPACGDMPKATTVKPSAACSSPSLLSPTPAPRPPQYNPALPAAPHPSSVPPLHQGHHSKTQHCQQLPIPPQSHPCRRQGWSPGAPPPG